MVGVDKPLPRGTSGVLGAAPLLYLTDPETGDLLRRRWRLMVVSGPDEGLSAELMTWTALVGAAPASALVLTDDAVSRYHAELDLFAEGLRVRDLDSTNGTFLPNEAPIRRAFLTVGQAFRVGESSIRLSASDEPLPEMPVEAADEDEFGEMIAAAPITRRLFQRLRRVAAVRSTVLLVGPTGSGKTALARALHEEGRRRNGPFVQLDLRAEEPSQAIMESARGGTLYLDRVESMPRSRQPALLELMANLPVGGRDLRVVASSTRPLEPPLPIEPRLAARLAVVVLHVPPLSARTKDVSAIARRFFAQRLKTPWPPGPQTLSMLESHDWPGQVAGLERALAQLRIPTPRDDGPFMRALRATFLKELLEHHRGHVTRAGEALGMRAGPLFHTLSAHHVDLDDM